jgi:hypothetical protein
MKCRHCNEWFDPKLSKEGKHDCKLQKPRQPSFYDKICFWDVETTTDSEGRHSANAVGASFEGEQFGVFSEVTFYDDALRHPADAEFRHDVFYRQYWPDDRELTPRPIKKRWATNEGAADVEGEKKKKEPSQRMTTTTPPRTIGAVAEARKRSGAPKPAAKQ